MAGDGEGDRGALLFGGGDNGDDAGGGGGEGEGAAGAVDAAEVEGEAAEEEQHERHRHGPRPGAAAAARPLGLGLLAVLHRPALCPLPFGLKVEVWSQTEPGDRPGSRGCEVLRTIDRSVDI